MIFFLTKTKFVIILSLILVLFFRDSLEGTIVLNQYFLICEWGDNLFNQEFYVVFGSYECFLDIFICNFVHTCTY